MVKLSLAFASLMLVLEHEFNFKSIVFNWSAIKLLQAYWVIDIKCEKYRIRAFGLVMVYWNMRVRSSCAREKTNDNLLKYQKCLFKENLKI